MSIFQINLMNWVGFSLLVVFNLLALFEITIEFKSETVKHIYHIVLLISLLLGSLTAGGPTIGLILVVLGYTFQFIIKNDQFLLLNNFNTILGVTYIFLHLVNFHFTPAQ